MVNPAGSALVASHRAATGKFRLTTPQPLELDIHKACASALQALLLPPAQWISLGIGAIKLAPAEMGRLVAIGIKAGWPDILVLHQLAWGIELKRPGGRLSETRIVRDRRGALREVAGQADVFPRLIATGAVGGIAVCTSVEEMLDQLARWKIPLRGANK